MRKREFCTFLSFFCVFLCVYVCVGSVNSSIIQKKKTPLNLNIHEWYSLILFPLLVNNDFLISFYTTSNSSLCWLSPLLSLFCFISVLGLFNFVFFCCKVPFAYCVAEYTSTDVLFVISFLSGAGILHLDIGHWWDIYWPKWTKYACISREWTNKWEVDSNWNVNFWISRKWVIWILELD